MKVASNWFQRPEQVWRWDRQCGVGACGILILSCLAIDSFGSGRALVAMGIGAWAL
jgi:hypothetical protein